MNYHNQKTKTRLSSWLKKYPHTGEYIVKDLLFIYFVILVAMLLYGVIQL